MVLFRSGESIAEGHFPMPSTKQETPLSSMKKRRGKSKVRKHYVEAFDVNELDLEADYILEETEGRRKSFLCSCGGGRTIIFWVKLSLRRLLVNISFLDTKIEVEFRPGAKT